jgi:KDO2-lipid IV(A) lauroyltransferase
MLRILLLIGRLPHPILYAFSHVIYWLVFYCVRYRRKTVDENLRRAFPEKSIRERTTLTKAFYRHLSEVIVETPMLAAMSEDELQQHITIEGIEHVQSLVERNQSFLVMSAHQANWEWMLAAVSYYLPCPLEALYRPIHQPSIEQFFRLTRSRFGANLLPAKDAHRAILRLRKSIRAFGLIADQTPRRQDPMCWLTFMGTQTAVSTGSDRIAQITRYPSVFVGCQRIRRGYYHCTIQPLTTPPYTEPDTLARAYMALVEAQIRQQPACWLWSHRRWRLSAPESATPVP